MYTRRRSVIKRAGIIVQRRRIHLTLYHVLLETRRRPLATLGCCYDAGDGLVGLLLLWKRGDRRSRNIALNGQCRGL